LTKSTALFSRGWLISFFVTGLIAAIALNGIVSRAFNAAASRGRLRRRRLMLVATEDDVEKLDRDIVDGVTRVTVAARVVVPAGADNDELDQILSAAAANARALNIEDVMISNTLSASGIMERCVAAFSMLPVAVHLTAGGLVSRFKDARVTRFGRSVSLSLTHEPLRSSQAFLKRVFDVVVASLALVLLSPILALIALAIRMESPGPALFRQRRRGYNHFEFSIFKFRTMTTMEDGEHIPQATVGDLRVTRIGRFLRNTSLDELPQLLNVLSGEMSLVGPRPHAVAHDRFFEALIPVYPRRLNVKPGITGWAQVNGFRGVTETQQAMIDRVEHDLYYIDNWSVAFDLYILMLTVLSSKTRRNAY
jgi:polysaccharide biosynthesis protein PslA